MTERTAVLPAVPYRAVDTAAVAATAAAAVVAAVRIALLFRYRIDSDETQHLHVAWAWAHGLLQYRDVFDNHMPLFHILAAPLVALVGERTEILVIARLAMLPLFAASALLTYRIACSAWSRSEAAWATLIGCLVPGFFLCSLEFRTDDLWTVCWLACIAILVGKKPRAAWSGLMLGLAAAISAKTLLLAVCLIGSAIATRLLMRDRSRIAVRAITFIVAALIPPALIAAYFALRGAWQPFLYCTTLHNLVTSEYPRRMLLLPVFLVIMVSVARRILRQDAPEEIRKRRLFLFLVASSYAAALSSLWPIIESEHWLPFYPLCAAAMVPMFLPRRAVLVLAFVELLAIVMLAAPWRDNVSPSTELIAQTMKLTSPADSVIDLKGEMLFRRRATYPVFEKITRKAISRGAIRDTLAGDVLRTRTMVVIADNDGLPAAGRAFLLRNFIPIARLRVAGQIVPPSGSFRVEVPGEYAVVSDSGNFRGDLDDVEYSAPRFLGAGVHTLTPATQSGRHAIIWQRAAALGFTPWR